MTIDSPNPQLREAVLESVSKHWGLFLAEGIILMLLGIAAIVVPPLATLAFTIFLGWLFLISGVAGLITTFWMRKDPGFWWSLLSALLGIAAGIVLLVAPASGILSLTLILIAFFIIEGVVSIMYAFDHRNDLPGGWVWMLISGIIDLVLAAMIFAGLPDTAAWAIGLLVGINMLFGGVALIAMAFQARRLTAH
ncbi:MAG TPA: HdeD family acid-resistance protein [Pseudolabrys sp.]|nr:HdeD family acid-resistance protein [Pseudolabrys sp.]